MGLAAVLTILNSGSLVKPVEGVQYAPQSSDKSLTFQDQSTNPTTPSPGSTLLFTKSGLLYKETPDGVVSPFGSAVKTASYVVFTDANDSNMIRALNGTTGNIDYSSTDAYAVIQPCINALSSGGRIRIRQGSYALSQALLFQGGYPNSYEWILEGEGVGTQLSQTSSGANLLHIKNGTNVSVKHLGLSGGSSAGTVVYCDGSGTDWVGHHTSLWGGKWDDVLVLGGSNGNYLFDGTNIFAADFGRMILVSTTAGCTPMRIYGNDPTNYNGNCHFAYLGINANASDGIQIHGPTIMNLNGFDYVGMTGDNISSYKGLVLGQNAAYNTFSFIDSEGFSDSLYIGSDYLDGGASGVPSGNRIVNGYLQGAVNAAHVDVHAGYNAICAALIGGSGYSIVDAALDGHTTYECTDWVLGGSSGGINFLNNSPYTSGPLFENKGTGTGTGSQQSIPHSLVGIPTFVLLSEYTTGGAGAYQSAAADATNIYVTAANARTFTWYAKLGI